MAKKYHNFAVGWVKQGKNGEYISGSAGGKNSKNQLMLKLEDGSLVEVTSFAGFFNEKKTKENQPDLSFTVALEQ